MLSCNESSSSSCAGRPCVRPSRPELCSPAKGSPANAPWACRAEGSPAPPALWLANDPAADDADEHGEACSAIAAAIPSSTVAELPSTRL